MTKGKRKRNLLPFGINWNKLHQTITNWNKTEQMRANWNKFNQRGSNRDVLR